MALRQVAMMTEKFQSVLDASVLNERIKQLEFAKRELLIFAIRPL